VSVINKMLLELDRRNATAGTDAEQPPRQVKAVATGHGGHEWFWRIVACLMLAALGWVGWVAFQLQPGPAIATDQAFQAAEQAKKGRISPVQPLTNVTGPVLQSPAAPAANSQESAAAPSIAPPGGAASSESKAPPPEKRERETPETLRLAQSIQTPIAEPRAAQPPKTDEVPAPAMPTKAEPAKPAAPAGKAAASKSSVDKRDRAKPASQLADAQFRRAALLLNQGRVSEAEEQLVGALQADPAHVPARQAYVALLLEQQRTDVARRVLSEALAVNPSHPTFALALARILAEQRDYAGALDVMDRAGSVANNADFLALRGAVLQRMNKHPEAIEAYQASVRGAAQPGTTWVGYAISLEALGRKAEAANAYRRSLGAGGLAREVREYAEARIRALE
jgi:MSHA biogenesis protein MshN